MVYLKNFKLLNEMQEHDIYGIETRTIFNSYYPLHMFVNKQMENIEFDNITIFYGGNGSGKTTLLNIIASRINAMRKNSYNKGRIFDLYVERCMYKKTVQEPLEIKFISSDDVFDYLLDIRAINANVNRKKAELSREWVENKYGTEMDYTDYDSMRNHVEAKKLSMSKYIRGRLGHNNIIEQSNGESALMFWEKEITEDSIYILDEPENSLSAENQLKLKTFIEESTRFYNCQFIISTHSPFLLSLNGAKIYDLDDAPVRVKKWTELSNVKMYYKFFKENENEFDQE